MPLKPLKYRRFHNGETDVLFSTSTCGIFQPDPLSLSILECLERDGSSTRQRLIHTLSREHQVSEVETAIDELVRAGFVHSFSECEGPEVEWGSLSHVPLPAVSHLVMNVSHSCNLRCDYCYADGGSYRGEKELMSSEVAIALVDFLLEAADDDKVMITFFGGEPLLNTDAIEAAVARGIEKSDAMGKEIDFGLTTNGTLLNEDVIRFVASHDIKLTVSIDGQRDAHDRHRKFLNGGGSYDMLVSSLPKLLKTGWIPARATLTRHNLDVVAIIDHLFDLGFSQVGFAPVDSADEEFGLGEPEMEQLLEGFETLADRFLEAALRGKIYGFTNIINMMTLFHQGDAKVLPCGAVLKLMCASPVGDFQLCHRFAGNNEFNVGSVRDGIEDQRRRRLLESVMVGSKPTCRACWAKHICGGGCHFLAQLHHGSVQKPHALHCHFLIKCSEFGIGISLDLVRGNPALLDRMTGEELIC